MGATSLTPHSWHHWAVCNGDVSGVSWGGFAFSHTRSSVVRQNGRAFVSRVKALTLSTFITFTGFQKANTCLLYSFPTLSLYSRQLCLGLKSRIQVRKMHQNSSKHTKTFVPLFYGYLYPSFLLILTFYKKMSPYIEAKREKKE